MPRNTCCVPGCPVVAEDGVPLHYFPNPAKEVERFKSWLKVIGGDFVNLDSTTVHKTRKICRRHFKQEFLYPKNRLCKLAVPSLFLPSGNMSEQEINPLVPDATPSTSQEVIISNTIKLTEKTSTVTSMQQKCDENILRKLELKLRRALKEKRTFRQRYLQAKKLSKTNAFEALTEKMSPAAKTLFKLQVKESAKKSKGRRFTLDEKILALSLYKPSPKAYRFLSQFCVLPSRRTLQNVLQKVNLTPGINEKIFKHLTKIVSRMPEKHKYSCILFDEMSIAPTLGYNKGQDSINGFVDNGLKREQIFCDHVLVFMLRGIIKKYKQPIAYSFCAGTTKTLDLKIQLRNIIEKLQKAGLKIVASVCDQGTTNLAAINSIIEDTKAEYLRRKMDYRGAFFEVGGVKIVPVFDPPHLLKGVRNNLINKNLKYKLNGEVRTAKWCHIEELFRRSPSFRGVKLMHKLTAHHVVPSMIPKMKVKHCAQVFSKSVGVTLGYMAENGNLPAESVDTAELLILFDDLFDSVNAKFNKEDGKIYRSAVTMKSPHLKFWDKTLPILHSMKFIKQNGQETTVPSITSWIKTIESFKYILSYLHSLGIKSLLLRNINQDPLENFFGAIRAHGSQNIMPNSAAFQAAFKTLLLNNITSPHSLQGNCEKDDSVCLKSLKSFLLENDLREPEKNIKTLDVLNEHLNIDLIDIQIMLESSSRVNVEKCAAIAYCSGWIATKAKRNIFKTCEICNKNLITFKLQPFHSYIVKKEYCGKRWLCYPTRELFNFFGQVENITICILNEYGHKTNIVEYISLIITVHLDLNFLQCEQHNKELKKYLLHKCVQFFTMNWCKEVNNILTGRSYINLNFNNNDQISGIFLQAREHYNKTKGKKRERQTGILVHV